MAKAIKLVDKSILSAKGSKKEPNSVCLFNNRAKAPSKASVKPAITKTIKALEYSTLESKILR